MPPARHAKVRLWLAQRPRFHVHYTPTYSSWLNQIERWFGLITQQAIRSGSFRSVKDLIARIDHFVQHYNRNCRPFAWTVTADSILQRLARLCAGIPGTQTLESSCAPPGKIKPKFESKTQQLSVRHKGHNFRPLGVVLLRDIPHVAVWFARAVPEGRISDLRLFEGR